LFGIREFIRLFLVCGVGVLICRKAVFPRFAVNLRAFLFIANTGFSLPAKIGMADIDGSEQRRFLWKPRASMF
jgi:hypothetical protein